MKVAFFHATTTAVEPINEAFRSIFPEAERFHFMDTGLLSMIQEQGQLTSAIIRRFSRLLNLAVESEVDCIQLTCSAFNDVTAILQPLYEVKLFRSDEAMLDEALHYNRIGLIATVKETPIALINYLKSKNPVVQVESVVKPGAIQLLFEGKQELHDQHVREMIKEVEEKVDVILLSQYSMNHVAAQVQTAVPLLTAPEASAKRCLDYFSSLKKEGEL